ncbi:MAG: hypothetical protein IKW18_02405, partial [Clostridia bacterium]|nr:hypothetical protein [Clostridia bacterium]
GGAFACKWAPAVTKDLYRKSGGSEPPPYKGVWALPEAMRCLQRCNTKAKLAIKRRRICTE